MAPLLFPIEYFPKDLEFGLQSPLLTGTSVFSLHAKLVSYNNFSFLLIPKF